MNRSLFVFPTMAKRPACESDFEFDEFAQIFDRLDAAIKHRPAVFHVATCDRVISALDDVNARVEKTCARIKVLRVAQRPFDADDVPTDVWGLVCSWLGNEMDRERFALTCKRFARARFRRVTETTVENARLGRVRPEFTAFTARLRMVWTSEAMFDGLQRWEEITRFVRRHVSDPRVTTVVVQLEHSMSVPSTHSIYRLVCANLCIIRPACGCEMLRQTQWIIDNTATNALIGLAIPRLCHLNNALVGGDLNSLERLFSGATATHPAKPARTDAELIGGTLRVRGKTRYIREWMPKLRRKVIVSTIDRNVLAMFDTPLPSITDASVLAVTKKK